MEFKSIISTNRKQTGNNLLVAPQTDSMAKNLPELSSQTQTGEVELANIQVENRESTAKAGTSVGLDHCKPNLDTQDQFASTAKLSHKTDGHSTSVPNSPQESQIWDKQSQVSAQLDSHKCWQLTGKNPHNPHLVFIGTSQVMDKGEGVRHEPEEDWWKVGNRFGVLASESDTASDSESFTSDTASTPTPANQSSPTPPPAEPSLAKDSLGEDSTPHEDSEDSAIHSGEEEQADPRLWICPNCDSPVEDHPATRKQHIKDTHTLAKPQPPTTFPTKHIQEEIEEPRCSISGKIKAECSLRDHHAGHTMLLEDMVKLAKQRSYVWEPHVCGKTTTISSPETTHIDQANNQIPTSVPTLVPINPATQSTKKSPEVRKRKLKTKAKQAKLETKKKTKSKKPKVHKTLPPAEETDEEASGPKDQEAVPHIEEEEVTLPPGINMAEETNGPHDGETNSPTKRKNTDLLICDAILDLARTEIAAWRLVLLALICMLKYTFGASIPASMILPIGAYAPAWIHSPSTKPGPAKWGQEEESYNDTTQTTPIHMEQPTTPSLPLAPIITAILLVMTGAGLMAAIYRYYNGRSSHPSQSANEDQEDNNEGAADVAPAEEDPVAGIQEGAVEIHVQDAEELVAVVQEEIGIMLNMRLHTILRKAPHLRTPLERLTVSAWAEQQAQL